MSYPNNYRMKCEELAEDLWNSGYWDRVFNEMYWDGGINTDLCFELLQRKAKESGFTLTDVDEWNYDTWFYESYQCCEKGLS